MKSILKCIDPIFFADDHLIAAILGGVKGGDLAGNGSCYNTRLISNTYHDIPGSTSGCNTAIGSQCVYLSGGLIKSPMCTCNTVSDCVPGAVTAKDTKTGFYCRSLGKRYLVKCSKNPNGGANLPNSYHGGVCVYSCP